MATQWHAGEGVDEHVNSLSEFWYGPGATAGNLSQIAKTRKTAIERSTVGGSIPSLGNLQSGWISRGIRFDEVCK